VTGLIVPVSGFTGGRVAVAKTGGLSALGSGSVAGRETLERGSICAEGIFPPGSDGKPPVGASDEARGPCILPDAGAPPGTVGLNETAPRAGREMGGRLPAAGAGTVRESGA
jgi:hypothetical protein